MKKVLNIIWRSLVVGIVYVAALVAGGMLVTMVGLRLPAVHDVQSRLLWSFIGGAIAGVFLGPIAASLFTTRGHHVLIWSSILFFNIASVTIEGRFFAPELVAGSLPGLMIQQLLAAVATGWIVKELFAPSKGNPVSELPHRTLSSWIGRFLASGFGYVIFYFIFGAINYALITKPYYETHAGGLTVPAPNIVLMAELVRGPLIVVSVLPFLLLARATKTQLSVLTGLILFAVGGLVPLAMQVSSLPFYLLAASAVEIFFQNFSTGVLSAHLLGRSE